MDQYLFPVLIVGCVIFFFAITIVIIATIVYLFKRRNVSYSPIQELTPLNMELTNNENLLHVQLSLRSTTYSLDKPCSDIGKKIKQLYFCTNKLNNQKLLLTVIEKETVKKDEKQAFIQFLKECKHPLIEPVENVEVHDKKVIIYRAFNPKGSLKDFIYKSSPYASRVNKYTKGIPLLPKYIQFYGKQILLILKVIQDQNLKYKIESSNVIFYGNQIKLSEIENSILKLPHPYDIYTKGDEILCFGHLLYEMATGYELLSNKLHDLDKFPVPKELVVILTKIFNNQYATFDQILDEPFFSNIENDENFKNSILNITPKMKELFK